MSINVSLPLIAPSGLQATVQAGGTIPVGAYDYVVVAFDDDDQSPWAEYSNQLAFHSPISETGNFTTTSGNQSVLINWTNVTGAL
jgi:hypothetical protein